MFRIQNSAKIVSANQVQKAHIFYYSNHPVPLISGTPIWTMQTFKVTNMAGFENQLGVIGESKTLFYPMETLACSVD